jgi:hypothetical protein
MNKTIATAFAAAIVAASSIASVAHAEGDYYEGAQKEVSYSQGQAGSGVADLAATASVDSGDYYNGAVRPN